MRWQPHLLDRLGRVRDVRVRQAEMELTTADARLAACRDAEASARQEVEAVTQRSELDIAQANRDLLTRRAGGRHGITDWHAARSNARAAVQRARGAADDASSERLSQELACSSARKRWRQMRLEVECLKLLIEGMESSSR